MSGAASDPGRGDRPLAIAVDGSPSPFFRLLLFTEIATGVLIFAHTRRTGFTDE